MTWCCWWATSGPERPPSPRGSAAALGITGPVTSPTFTLVRQYPVPGAGPVRLLLHADVYRLDSLAEVAELALPELAEEGAVVLVEWGDRGGAGPRGERVGGDAAAGPGATGPDGLGAARRGGDPCGRRGAEPAEGVADEPEPRRVAVARRGPGWAAPGPVAGALGALGVMPGVTP